MQPVAYTTRYETNEEANTFNENWNAYTDAKKRSEQLGKILIREKTKLASAEALIEQTKVKEVQLLEKMENAQVKIEKGQALKIEAQELAVKADILKKKGEALAEKSAALHISSQEKAAKAQVGVEQKCKALQLELEKTIKVLNSKTLYVSKFVESEEKRSLLEDLRQLILKAEGLKLEAQPTLISLQKIIPEFKQLGLNFNELILKIGK